MLKQIITEIDEPKQTKLPEIASKLSTPKTIDVSHLKRGTPKYDLSSIGMSYISPSEYFKKYNYQEPGQLCFITR